MYGETASSGAASANVSQLQRALSNQVATPRPTSASQIRDVITAAESLGAELHHALNELEERLETVLTPVPPDVGGSPTGSSPAPPRSSVHLRIVDVNHSTNHAIARLRQLVQRVEV